MKIEGLGVPQQPDPKGKKPRDTDQSNKAGDGQRPVSDSIELTKDKKQIGKAGYTSDVTKGGQSDPSAKEDLAELKRKSTNGFYDEYETREKTSEKLIESKELEDVVREYDLSNLSQEIIAKDPDIRHDKVADARRRMAEGFYDNPANYGDIADKIINHFGL